MENNQLIVLELFAGTRAISRAFEARGHKTYSVEWNKNFKNITLYEDINNLSSNDIINMCGRKPDVIWASPDCTTYSLAALTKHRSFDIYTGNFDPITDYAKFCDKTNIHLLKLIKELNPKYYFIENPRGGLRKMTFMNGLPRYTITYCQYGDSSMKPTDIWTNHPNPNFKPMCKRNSPCHSTAMGNNNYGIQKVSGKKNRAIIPKELCEYIVKICEEGMRNNE